MSEARQASAVLITTLVIVVAVILWVNRENVAKEFTGVRYHPLTLSHDELCDKFKSFADKEEMIAWLKGKQIRRSHELFACVWFGRHGQ